jgi:hypothetical protein
MLKVQSAETVKTNPTGLELFVGVLIVVGTARKAPNAGL